MITPLPILENHTLFYLPRISRPVFAVYAGLLVFIIGGLAALPFVYVDVTVRVPGIVRPAHERTEIRSLVSGVLDTVFVQNGTRLKKGAPVFRVKDMNSDARRQLNRTELVQRAALIQDLLVLTQTGHPSVSLLDSLQTPLYREQAARFIHQLDELDAMVRKANREMDIHRALARDNVISRKEYFDVQINQERCLATYRAARREQLANWQQDLFRYRIESSQLRQQMQQINGEAGYYELKSPVDGVVQMSGNRYAGGIIQANEVFCMISPEEALVGECYVPTKDIGLLKTGQHARYQLDAFNYNYFGILTGQVSNIDNDYTEMGGRYFYRLVCTFDQKQLRLRNGFSGELKKGMGFQAGFVVARRSLWQLLFDNLNDWLNPLAPQQKQAL